MKIEHYVKGELIKEFERTDIDINISSLRIDVDNDQLILDFHTLPIGTSKDNPVYHAIIDVGNIKINISEHLPPS